MGNESAASEKLQVKTLPDTDAPEVPVISQLTNAGIGSVTIRWSAVSDNIRTTNYKVYRGDEQVYSGSATEFTDNGLRSEHPIYLSGFSSGCRGQQLC